MFKDEFAESESEFEKVLLKKGSLIVKEFKDCCVFENLTIEAASVLDMETGRKVYAARITTGYWNSQYDYGEAIDVMDADEIDGAIKTLEYIKQSIDKMEDYTEVVYEASRGVFVPGARLGGRAVRRTENVCMKLLSTPCTPAAICAILTIGLLWHRFQRTHAAEAVSAKDRGFSPCG